MLRASVSPIQLHIEVPPNVMLSSSVEDLVAAGVAILESCRTTPIHCSEFGNNNILLFMRNDFG